MKKKKRSAFLETLKESFSLFIGSILITLILLYFIVHFFPPLLSGLPINFDNFMLPFAMIIIGGVVLNFFQRVIRLYTDKRKEIKRYKKNGF